MNFCPKCRKKLVVQDFCVECGADLSEYLNNDTPSNSLDTFDFSSMEKEAVEQLKEKTDKENYEKSFEIKNGVLVAYKGDDESVTVPEGVTVIGKGAFYGKINLVSVVLPKKLKAIEERAFDTCVALEQASIPSGTCSIGERAFFCCSSLKELVMPNSVVELGEKAFYGCESLEKIKISSGLSEIKEGVFQGCKALKEVEIPNGVEKIGGCGAARGAGAFEDCVSLKRISLPVNLTVLGHNSLKGCGSLTEIQLPNGLVKIGCAALSGIRRIKEIHIPSTVEEIDYEAFANCASLERVTTGKGSRLSYLGNYSYKGCVSLREAIIPVADEPLMTKFEYSEKSVPASLKKVVVLGGNAVCDRAFTWLTEIEEIVLPNSIREIGEMAFAMCKSLKKVNASGVRTIGNQAFAGCPYKG